MDDHSSSRSPVGLRVIDPCTTVPADKIPGAIHGFLCGDLKRTRLQQITVAGAGNWLLACDRVGPRVIADVADRYGEDVDLCDIGCSALALLDHLHGQELLIVIDACIGRGRAGEVFVVEPDLDVVPGRGATAHQIGPVETLVIARHLEPTLMPKRVVLLLVETGELDEQEEADAYHRLIELLDHEIEDQRQYIESNSKTVP